VCVLRRLGGLFASIPEAIVCLRVSDCVFGCQIVRGLISDGVSDCVWGGRTGPTIKPKTHNLTITSQQSHTISQLLHNNLTQSHNYFTTISHNLTITSQQSHTRRYTISQLLHNNLTQSHNYFTTISHPKVHNLTITSQQSHNYFTTISQLLHNNLTISSKNCNFAHFLSTFTPLNSHFTCTLFPLIFNEKNFKKTSNY
jgi:hypothetical protein